MRQIVFLFALFAVVACSDDRAVLESAFDLEELGVPAAEGSAEPNLAIGADGTALLSWLEPVGEGHALRFSILNGDGWGKPFTIAQSTDWFINWADFPSVVPVAKNLWAAHWLHKTPGSVYSYDVRVSVSADRGKTWSQSVSPHTDGTRTEHGFVTLFPHGDGFGAIWLDGRKTAGEAHADETGHDSGNAEAGMTLRAATLSKQLEIAAEQEVDGLVCDCCQTDVAITSTGPIAVYRDRSAGEIRDIYASRFLDGRWQEGIPVANDNWEIGGCPVNGPAIAAVGERVVVAWFTAANGVSRTKLAFSSDAGETFGEPIIIDSGKVLGRVGVALLPDGAAVVSWLKNVGDGRAEIRLQRVTADGLAGPANRVAGTSAARISGFPQLVALEDSLLLAWTDVTDSVKSIRSARVAVSSLYQR
jgi:hypothetical protein